MPPKQVIAVRHGESEWNVLRREYSSDEERYLPIMYTPDCNITVRGTEQSQKAGDDLSEMLSGDFTLIVSPLRRALQTAQNMLQTFHESSCSFELTKTVVHPAAAEVMVDACDIGTNTDKLKEEFPDYDFGLLEKKYWWAFGRNAEETWERMRNREPEGKETDEMVLERFQKLREFIRACESDSIVIVCHSETIWWLTRRIIEGEGFGVWTANGECLEVTPYLLEDESKQRYEEEKTLESRMEKFYP